MLTAANTVFLWMLPLAAIPIVFHLFFRIRKRTRPVPSLLLFRRADPRLHARKRIREWLALLLRVLTILLFLLALVRLRLAGSGRGGNTAQVLVIDNSGSMAAPARGGVSRLAAALQGAAALVSELGGDETAGLVLLVDDPTAAIPAGLSSDRAALLAALGRIRETQASGGPARALDGAFALLRTSNTSQREVHIFSDLQATEWGRAPSHPFAPPAGTVVLVHRVRAQETDEANVAVVDVRLPARRPVAGRPLVAEVEVSNRHGDAETHVRLNREGSGGTQASHTLTIPPHESRSVRLALRPASAGFHWEHVWIEDRALACDNEAYFGFTCAEKQSVLLLGKNADFAALALALSPAGRGDLSGLHPVARPAAELIGALAEFEPAMVVATWSDLARMANTARERRLRAAVAEGDGTTLFVLPDPGRTEAVAAPAWLGGAPGRPIEAPEGIPVVVFERRAALWEELRDESGEIMLGRVRARRFRPLDVAPGAVSLAGLEDGRTLLAWKRLGNGCVASCGLAFDPAWSDLPLRAGSLALVQGLALVRSAAPGDTVPLVAGDSFPVPPGFAGQLRITTVAGAPMEWCGAAAAVPVCPRAGVYRVMSADRTVTVTARGSEREGEGTLLRKEPIHALGRLSHELLAYRDQAGLLREVRRRRRGTDLSLPLLLAALAAVTVEAWVVNPRPVRRSARDGWAARFLRILAGKRRNR